MTEQAINKPKAIKGVSKEATEFFTCIILHMLVPLLPLFIELWVMKGVLTEETLTITASMYSISIGLSSRNKAVFSLCLFAGILFSMAFGFAVSNETKLESLPLNKFVAIITILMVFIIHSCERYNRHLVECTPFWSFGDGDRG